MASIYKILSTGNRILADQEFVEQVHPGDWEYVMDEPAPVQTERRITGVEFLRRFTMAQRIAIRALSKTDPVVDDFMRLLDAAIAQGSGVNLLDPDTVAGIGYLAKQLPSQSINPAEVLA